MKYYYYLLYRLYWFSRDFNKDSHKMAIYAITLSSSLFLWLFKEILIGFIYYFRVEREYFPGGKIGVIIGMVCFAIINYYLFIRKEKFLRLNFSKDKKGGYLIILTVALLAFLNIVVANKNRDKISLEEIKIEKIITR